ncbi:MAG: thiamine/thiamine pyrophosphate ABC transporter permease ThiP [Albidovulum sp.]|nr:thiamine/thiamine pyrophosphate ABC transporter permease ThiP [Albidovulum sp.]MDE0533391.1 thiamine/thiamine pyrophosphate ABC transporter permease ThiP [Albidovulum sp.]
MARRANPLIALAGAAAIIAVALVTLVPVATLWINSDRLLGRSAEFEVSAADIAALRFTLLQAFLSAAISVVLAVPVARAIFRRKFFGRELLISVLGAPFLLPVIVAVIGLLAVWGRSGWISAVLISAGYERISIYGLSGVLLAHVFFNLPLATRIILQAWSRIPAEHFRLAEQIGMSPSDQFRHLEWPMLRSVAPGAFLLIALICASSFAVVLALGGGPRATTLELAIFEAIRFDFDLGRAASLALVQFAIGVAFAVVVLAGNREIGFGGGIQLNFENWSKNRTWAIAIDAFAIGSLIAFVGLPLLAIFLEGVGKLPTLPPETWPALINSISIAMLSTAVSVFLGLALSVRIASLSRFPGRAVEIFSMLALSASPLVIGTGLFLLLQPFVSPFNLALPVTALVNSAMSMPLIVRILLPACRRTVEVYGPLVDSLGIRGWSAIRLVYWPSLRSPAGFSAGIAAALSMGDLGVVALFAPPEFATLPLVVYRLMGAYRTDQAEGAALLLVMASFALFFAFDRGGRLGHHA